MGQNARRLERIEAQVTTQLPRVSASLEEYEAALARLYEPSDEDRLAFIGSFRRGLRDGLPAVEALRRAEMAPVCERDYPRRGADIVTMQRYLAVNRPPFTDMTEEGEAYELERMVKNVQERHTTPEQAADDAN